MADVPRGGFEEQISTKVPKVIAFTIAWIGLGIDLGQEWALSFHLE